MAFVSLKKLLAATEAQGIYQKAMLLLLNGIADTAVRADGGELGRFREEMEKLGAAAREAGTEEQLLVTIGSMLQALDSYNERATRVLRRQEAEMQHIASMLAQTVIAITEGSDRSGEVLAEIKCDLEHAAAVEDLQNVRFRLAECLGKVREEALRQKRESEATLATLREQLLRTQAAPDGPDPATGLRCRAAAIQALDESLKTGGKKYVVAMVMERFELLQVRYGAAVANESLRAMSRHLEQQLGNSEGLFRWSGPALVGILRRPETIDIVRAEVKRVVEFHLQRSFDIGKKSVMINISAAWSVIGLVPPAADVVRRIDHFVASQTPRELAS